MKKLIYVTIFTLITSSQAFATDFRMTCDLRSPINGDQLPKYKNLVKLLDQFKALKHVDGFTADTSNNTVSLLLKDGSTEVLTPQKKVIMGPFGPTDSFDGKFNGQNGTFFVQSAVAGDVFVKHYCTLGDIPFQRCYSQGDMDHAEHFGTIINVEGHIINLTKIFGSDWDGHYNFLCTREVI